MAQASGRCVSTRPDFQPPSLSCRSPQKAWKSSSSIPCASFISNSFHFFFETYLRLEIPSLFLSIIRFSVCACVFVCTCTCVDTLCVCVWTPVCLCVCISSHVFFTSICVHTFMCLWVRVCTHLCKLVHICVSMCLLVLMCLCMLVHTCMSEYVCVCIFLWVCVHCGMLSSMCNWPIALTSCWQL